MKKLFLIPLVCMLMALSSCPEYVNALTEEKFQERLETWKAENPDQVLTPEKEAEIRDKARQDAIAQAKKDTEDALGAGGSAVTGFGTGNYVGGALGLITLIGLAFGIRSKIKKGKKA